MTQRFGDRAAFAIEIGEVATPGLRVVDLWVADVRLTVNDNAAYVPALCLYMGLEAQKVRQHDIPACPFPGREPEETFRLLDADETEFREQFWFMRWTEIRDNVSIYAYLDTDLVIVFKFWREDHPCPKQLGNVFASRIPPEEFLAVVDDALNSLHTSTAQNQEPAAPA